MIDMAAAYNRYKFLGYEFLTWTWYTLEHEPEKLTDADHNEIDLKIGNRLVLENRTNNNIESITIKGDDPGLEEGLLALKKGAFVTEMELLLQEGDFQWQFSIKGESLNISGIKTPATGPVEQKDDIEGAVLEKIFLLEKPVSLLDALYENFIKAKISPGWNQDTAHKIKKWITP